MARQTSGSSSTMKIVASEWSICFPPPLESSPVHPGFTPIQWRGRPSLFSASYPVMFNRMLPLRRSTVTCFWQADDELAAHAHPFTVYRDDPALSLDQLARD